MSKRATGVNRFLSVGVLFLSASLLGNCGDSLFLGGEGHGRTRGESLSSIVIANGETQPVFSRADAIIESVFVEAPIDSDGDGKNDLIALDIIRPKDTLDGLKVATVMEASPYYRDTPSPDEPTRTEFQIPGATPRNFQRWYDEFFIPFGYAVVEVEMQGTSRSKGCPTTGGKEDTASIVAAIDWLNGRARGFDASGNEVFATWSTGKVGMLGVSYNGTLPIAVAAEGVPGLETVVPIAAISSWYDYTRDQGIGYAGWDQRYPQFLANFVVSQTQRPICQSVLTKLGDSADDGNFDETPFYEERDYRLSIDKLKASVLLVHGQEDWNVKPRHYGRLWKLLEERNIPRKLWLHPEGHLDPISIDRARWQRQIHHWMDHWLYGVDNGVMSEPMLTVQRPDRSWHTDDVWPPTGTRDTVLYFGTPGSGNGYDGGTIINDGGMVDDGGIVTIDGGLVTTDGGLTIDGGIVVVDGGTVVVDGGNTVADSGTVTLDGGSNDGGGVIFAADGGVELFGTLRLSPDAPSTMTIIDNPSQREHEAIAAPEILKPARLAFLSSVLSAPVRISGIPKVRVTARFDTTSSPLSAILVDYGDSQTPVPRSFSYGEMFAMSCDYSDLENGTGCAAQPTDDVPQITSAVIVTKGTIDVKNRLSIKTPTPIPLNERVSVEWELHPKDHVFPAGHRIGIVILANDASYASVDRAARSVIVSLEESALILPVAAGGFIP